VIAFERGPASRAGALDDIDGTGQRSFAVEQATLTEPVAAMGGDSAVFAAVFLALEKLPNRIAAGIERNLD
jgi:hypothetical protein